MMDIKAIENIDCILVDLVDPPLMIAQHPTLIQQHSQTLITTILDFNLIYLYIYLPFLI